MTSGADALDWDDIVAQHTARLRRMVARRVRADGIDDVIQETFLRAYRSRHCLDADRPIGPWLRTIALRVATDATARNGIPVQGFGATVAADAASDYASAEGVAVIRKALGLLNPRHRELLEAVALDGVTQAAIAEREGVAPEVIRAAVMRARQRFRTVYERLAQEHGLAATVSAIKPAVVRVRQRLEGPRVPPYGDLVTKLLGMVALGSMAFASTNESSDRSKLAHTPTASLHGGGRLQPTAPHADEIVRVGLSAPVLGRGAGITLQDDRVPNVDEYWTLSDARTGLSIQLGTDGSRGSIDADMSPGQNQLGAGSWGDVTVECGRTTTAKVMCLAIATAEDVLRTVREVGRPYAVTAPVLEVAP